MKRTQLLHLALLLVSALFMGCGTGLHIPVTRPAQVNLKNYDKIAVREIKDDIIAVREIKVRGISLGEVEVKKDKDKDKDGGNHSFSDDLIQALLESGRFEVLDYEVLKTAFSHNNLVMSSLTNGGNEEEIRKLFGNIVLISGSILNNYKEDLTHKDVEHKNKKTGEITTK